MRSTMMALIVLTLTPAAALAATPASKAAADARADSQKMFGFVPGFLKALPDAAVPALWAEMKGLQMNPSTAVPGKIKELIGLAVAAQIPCEYCIVAHTEFAKLNGATDQEIGEAVAMGGLTRHWSTILNGLAIDEVKFRGEIARLVDGAKLAAAQKKAPPPAIEVIDAATAKKDMEQSFGFVPDFTSGVPDEALPGAWMQLRDVQLNPNTALSGKAKELIGLAVAAQVPCRYCVVAHTAFAKLNGATDREIHEAVAMAALTRNASTLLNGLQIEKPAFRKDVARLVDSVKKQMAQKHASR